jgi:hypothetical protein
MTVLWINAIQFHPFSPVGCKFEHYTYLFHRNMDIVYFHLTVKHYSVKLKIE